MGLGSRSCGTSSNCTAAGRRGQRGRGPGRDLYRLASRHRPTLPLPARELTPTGRSAIRCRRGANVRVVLVDDERDAREVLAGCCGAQGPRCARRMGPGGRLAMIEMRPPRDRGDVGMPEQDGYAFMKRVRGLAPARATPAIALTAYARNADGERALAAGYQLHVAKPLDPRTIVEAVHRAVRSAAATRPTCSFPLSLQRQRGGG